jgi:hypothetical protein
MNEREERELWKNRCRRAIREEEYEKLKDLLDDEPQWIDNTEDDEDLLFFSVYMERPEAVEMLLDREADPRIGWIHSAVSQAILGASPRSPRSLEILRMILGVIAMGERYMTTDDEDDAVERTPLEIAKTIYNEEDRKVVLQVIAEKMLDDGFSLPLPLLPGWVVKRRAG